MKIILASASDRRKELLSRIIEDFDIIFSEFNEDSVDFKGDIGQYTIELAKGKALDVLEKAKDNSIIIGCDTIVAINNKLLGKPKDEDEALYMLRMLSGKTHQVYSGLAIINSSTKEIYTDYACTDITFSELSDRDILRYIKSGDPMDKAGAYGIQGIAGVFVEKINGCYYSVVGLPINKLNKLLKGMGVNL
ncbi:Maf-like protein [Clostridium sediminicola]|uniref:Maf-like protein n=1 Tax=Clostridium sediminicola TaxID=3114879 RepID=UPI0031F1E01D